MNLEAAHEMPAQLDETAANDLKSNWLLLGTLVVFSIGNWALGHSLQSLADRVAEALKQNGMVMVALTYYTMKVPSMFYILALSGLLCTLAAFLRRASHKVLTSALVLCLVGDIMLLYVAAWGFCIQFLPWGILVDPSK